MLTFPACNSSPASDPCSYNFERCKLCGAETAHPTYLLKKTTVYACPVCDFHYINYLDDLPPVVPDEILQPIDHKSRSYIESCLPANELQHRINLQLVKCQTPLSGKQCLDIGAGAGLFAHLLAETGAVVQGIEPQVIFRAFAREKFGIELRGETVDARCWQQSFRAFFDLVTLWDVFEHVNFPAELLQQAANLVKPGGLLVLDTPRRDALYYRISEWSYRLSRGANPLFLETLYSPLPFRHKQIFTLSQLLQLVERSGFSVLAINSSVLRMHNKMVLVCRKEEQRPESAG